MNLSFLPIGLGIPLALATSAAYAQYASGEMKRQPYFEEAISIYAVAAVAELLSEPLYNVFVSCFFPSLPIGSMFMDLKIFYHIEPW